MFEFTAFGFRYGEKTQPAKKQTIVESEKIEYQDYEQLPYVESSEESECPSGG